MHWLAVALGGALGAMGRYAIVLYTLPIITHRFPVATLITNVLGSLLIGVVYVLVVEKAVLGEQARLVLMTGFLGAFTTFSTFALESLTLFQNGHAAMAAGYLIISVLGCLLAVWAGYTFTLRFI